MKQFKVTLYECIEQTQQVDYFIEAENEEQLKELLRKSDGKPKLADELTITDVEYGDAVDSSVVILAIECDPDDTWVEVQEL